MQTLPRVRWLLAIFVSVLAAAFSTGNFDIIAALQTQGVEVTGIVTALLAVAKLVATMKLGDEPMYYAQGRDIERSSFWRRMW